MFRLLVAGASGSLVQRELGKGTLNVVAVAVAVVVFGARLTLALQKPTVAMVVTRDAE